MKKDKKIMIILGLIIFILLTAIIIIYNLLNKGKAEQEIREDPAYVELEYQQKISAVERKADYYIAKDCTEKYYHYYSALCNIEEYADTDDEEELEDALKTNKNILYNMLDNEYIEQKKVTKENIDNNLKNIGEITVNVTDMYVSENDNKVNVYIVQGLLKEIGTKNAEKFSIIVKVDFNNKTFSVLPQEYVQEKYSNIKVGGTINVDSIEAIKDNKYNTFKYKNISEEDYVIDLFNNFKNKLIYYTDSVYGKLNEQYRNKKFANEKEFYDYIESNKNKYEKMNIAKYIKNINDGYTQYVCIDQDENYYILDETSVMEYTLMLDAYTVELPDSIERYNDADEPTKAGMNLNKVFEAAKSGDYNYIYSKLDETFKQNNFQNEANFKRYFDENFANKEFEYKNGKEESGLYMFNVTVKNGEESYNKQFIIKLENETDFIMSFSI